MNTEIAIQVENLSKVYPLRQPKTDKNGGITNEHWALKGVSFEVKKGESIGIIGPNGSGKSTLLKILAGVTKPTSGKVSIRGKVASILDIGAGFHPELSGRENVFLNGQIHGFSKKEIELKFDEIVAFSGIEQFIDEPVKNYSNGMYLRLAFSIMTHMEFDVYLFDEVLYVGDERFSHKVREKIHLLKQLNKTIILTSHNYNEIKDKDIFIILEDGIINQISSNIDVLLKYIENNSDKKSLIGRENIIIESFQGMKTPKELDLLKFELFHDHSTQLRTDLALNLKLQYEQLTDNTTIIPIISLTDIYGNRLLSSSPVMSNILFSPDKTGIHTYQCIIPPFLLGNRVYGINLYFIKHEGNQPINIETDALTDKDFKNEIFEIAPLILFKPELHLQKSTIDLSNFLNMENGLLPLFEWSCETDKTKI